MVVQRLLFRALCFLHNIHPSASQFRPRRTSSAKEAQKIFLELWRNVAGCFLCHIRRDVVSWPSDQQDHLDLSADTCLGKSSSRSMECFVHHERNGCQCACGCCVRLGRMVRFSASDLNRLLKRPCSSLRSQQSQVLRLAGSRRRREDP